MSSTSEPLHLTAAQQALLDALLTDEALAGAPSTIPRRAPDSGAPPLSSAQKRLWFLDQFEGPGAAYNVALAFSLHGPLAREALEQGLQAVVHRHESLRTTFGTEDGEPYQKVGSAADIVLDYVDFRDHDDPAAAVEQRATALAHAPFDLARGPLLRAGLLQQADDRHVLVLVLHHIIADDWSLRIFCDQLARGYAAAVHGVALDLPPPAIQYADYASWEAARLAEPQHQARLDHQRALLAGAPSALDLPLDKPRSAQQQYRGASAARSLTPTLSDALLTIARRHGITPATLLQTAWATLLHRLSGQDTILLGVPAANRERSETEQVIGLFLNTLVIRYDFEDEPTFATLLRRAAAAMASALDQQDLPFDALVRLINPPRDLSRHPLFQVMFVYQQDVAPSLELAEVSCTRFDLTRRNTKFDLTLFALPLADGLRLNLEYCCDLFEPASIERILDYLTALLHGIAADPEMAVGQLPLREAGTAAPASVPPAAGDTAPRFCLHQSVAQQAARTPHAVAVEVDGVQITYETLDQAANGLAAQLTARGAGPDIPVAVLADGSPRSLVAMLAILKAGSAYLPLDPALPDARLALMLTDAGASLVLASEESSARCRNLPGALHVIPNVNQLPRADTPPRSGVTPDHLLYILYTSGSTGRPKGVAMHHAALANLLTWQLAQDGGAANRTLQFSAPGFDVSCQEIFATWMSGGTLVLLPDDARRDSVALAHCLAERQIQRLFLPFAALNQLAETVNSHPGCPLPGHLRHVITAGEQLRVTPALVNLFSRLPGCRLHNQYGPTETHVVTAHTLATDPAAWPALPPIGRPVANTSVLLLDRRGAPVPPGVTGEIVAAGPGVARGYVGDGELTAARFITVPPPGNRRAYRTGDLGRILPDGNLQFLGRSDQQVKIRGYRVEPGEVEATLARHPAVAAVTVVAAELEEGRLALAAYVVAAARATVDPPTLRRFLRETLPDYLVPEIIMPVAELPRTASGKIDRRRLPPPERPAGAATGPTAPPRDTLESELMLLWQTLLDTPPTGIDDDFFDLGGHSLLAVRLFAGIEQLLGRRLPLNLLFESPTIRGLASAIRSFAVTHQQPIVVPIQRGAADQPPLFFVHGAGGGVVGYATLSRRLGGTQPVYGLQAHGFDGLAEPDTTIPAMAARYIQALKDVQPAGPYYLGGYCLGGIVAFEMACQLAAAGEKVAHLAILEGYAPLRGGGRVQLWRPRQLLNFLRNLPYWLGDYVNQGPSSLVTVARRQARRGLGRILPARRAAAPSPEDVMGAEQVRGVPEHHRRLLALQIQAQIAFDPTTYPGPLTLYRVRRLSLLRAGDPLMGWGKLAQGGVELVPIPGRHNNILQEPHVAGLARLLAARLAASR